MITPALYYFTSSALSIDLNVNTGSDGFQTSETCSVSVAAGAAVKIANLLTTRAGRNLNIGYDAQLGYRKFIFTGYNTVFGYALVGGNKVYRYSDAKIRAYIRLDASDNGTNGELIFLPYEVDYDGTILLEDGEELVQYPDIALATDEEGQLITPYALANTDANNTSGLAFYYIHIGTINIPEAGTRSWLNVIQSGQLETAKGNNEDGTGVWAKMFHLSPSNIIEVLLPFDKLSFHNSGDTFIDRITNQHGDDASLVDADFGNFTEWIYQHTIATTRSVAAYIKAKIAELDNKYFRKDQADTDPHLATFGDVHVQAGLSKGSGAVSSGSLEVDGNASVAGDTELNGDVTIGASASNEAIVNAVMQVLAQMKSQNYVDDSPIGKGGWNLLSADDNGNSYMVIDKLFVRLKAIFNELEIRKISYAGGNIILSHAGSEIVGVKPLYRNGAIYAYRCYCKKDDGTTATENWWKVDDQAKCQTFNIQEGVHQNVENTYYWRKVIAVGSEMASLDGTTSEELYNYADLSLGDCDANSDIPKAGDSIIQMGNRTDTERQGFISLEVFGSDAPAIKVYKGVNGYNLNNKMPIIISPKNTSMRVQHYEIETDYGVFPAVKERGEWDLISNHRCYYFDRVQHNGSSWLCTYPQGSTPAYTTEEPSVNATYWKVDAQAGESAPSYTEEWYAWSNVQSVVNATTEPTPNGGWYQVIGGQGEYAYLWKKLIRYTWNSATRVYVAGTAQYYRMSGTNGTSISVKGSVATVADLPSTHADGDAYVVEADRHLYMWSAEGNQWLDIGEFKGEDGRTYYTHVAWATSVTTNPSTGEVTNVTGFTIAKTADDTTHLWMGVYVDENSAADPDDALLYTWSYTKGVAGNNGYNTATLFLYKRSATAISLIDWSNTLTYTFANKTLSPIPTGWSLNTIPSGTDPIYVTAATAYSNTATDSIEPNEWAAPVKYVENGAQGEHGLNTASVFLYQRAASAPTKPSSALTYAFATGLLSGTLGDWSQNIPATDGNPCWVIQATAIGTGTTDSIAANEWSTQKKMVEDGKDGKSVQAQYSSDGTSWHDAFATGDEWMRTRTTGGSWSDAMKIVGENGEDGDYTDFTFGISQYLTTANVNTAPADISSWSDAPLATTDEKPYLWSKQVKHTFNNGTETTSTPKYIRLTGEQGESAISSISLASHDIYFARNNSGTTAPSSGWGTDTLAPTAENKYVWRKDVYTYDSQEYGRNIQRGTATPVIGSSGVAKWSNGQIRISQPSNGSISVSDEDLPDVPGVTSAVIITETASGQVGFCQDAVPLKAKRITQSCWIKGDAGVSVALQPAWISNVGVGNKNVTCDGTWQRVECSGTVPEAKNWSIGYVYLNANQVGKTLKVAGMKVEYGDEATDWCIAPEDLNSEDVYVWAVYGENAVQLTLDNQHEDFLYSESNANQPIAPQNGATSQAYLFDGATEKSATWAVSVNGGSSYVENSDSFSTGSVAKAKISSSGLLTVAEIYVATAVIKVRATYNGNKYYADFTANKTSQDRYELKTTPSSIAFNSDDLWVDKTISLSAERTDLQGGKSTPSISPTANSGNLRVFTAWVNSNGSLGTLSRLNATTKTISSSDASTYMGIYFELRWYFDSSTADSGAATTYRVCDFETVEIAKTANGATGPTGKGIVLDLKRDNYTEAQWNSWCTIGNNGSWGKNTDYDPADLDFTTAIRVGDYFTISGTATDSGLLHASIHRCTSITSSTKIYGTCTSHVKSGDSPLIIDTDNDADQFGTDSDNVTQSAQTKVSKVMLYYGSTAQTLKGLTATVYLNSTSSSSIGSATTSSGSSTSGNVTINSSVVGGINVSYTGTTGTVTLTLLNGATIAGDLIVKINAKCDRDMTGKEILFTVQQVKSGAAGDTPIIYQLHPSEKAFAFGRTDMNELTPASIVSQIGVEKTEGNTSTIINTTVAGLTYSWGFDSDAAKQTGRAIGTSITVAKADAEAHRTVWIQLYNNSVAGDKETLPITKDGKADKPFIVQRDDTYVLVRDCLWLAEGWSTNCAEGHTLEIEKIDGVDADFDHFSIGDTFIVTGYDRTDGTLHFATFLCTAVSAESITGICYNHWLSGDPGMTGYEPPFLYDKVTLYALSNSGTVAPVDTQQETVWDATRPSTTTEKRFVWQKDCYTYTESEKGRNIMRGTADLSIDTSSDRTTKSWQRGKVYISGTGGTVTRDTSQTLPITGAKSAIKVENTDSNQIGFAQGEVSMKVGYFMMSFWVKGTSGTTFRVQPAWNSATSGLAWKSATDQSNASWDVTLQNSDWTLISYKAYIGTAATTWRLGYIYLRSVNKTIYVAGMKIEYGETATDWSQAPEDYYKEDIRVIERAGEAGIDVSLQDPVAIFTQNVTTNVVSSEKPKTNIIVTKGGVPVALTEYAVAKPSAIPSDVNCNYTVTDSNSEKSVEITSIWTAETIEGVNYPEEQGYAPIRVTYQGQTYDLNFKFYCNAMGKFKRTVEGDVETSIANKTWYEYNPATGQYDKTTTMGDFIRSSSKNTSVLTEKTNGAITSMSEMLQRVDGISFKVYDDSNVVDLFTHDADIPIKSSMSSTGTIPTVASSVNVRTICVSIPVTMRRDVTTSIAMQIQTKASSSGSVIDTLVHTFPITNGVLTTSNNKGRLDVLEEYTDSNKNYLRGVLYFEKTFNNDFKVVVVQARYTGNDAEIVFLKSRNFLVGGISMKAGLKATGIDIEAGKIVNTADRWECQNNNGVKTAWLDDMGNFTIRGVYNNLITVIDSTNVDKYIIGIPASNPTEWYLDVLLCGTFVKLEALPSGFSGMLKLPYYANDNLFARGYTRYLDVSTSTPRQMTSDELRMLAGRKMVISWSTAIGANNDTLGYVFAPEVHYGSDNPTIEHVKTRMQSLMCGQKHFIGLGTSITSAVNRSPALNTPRTMFLSFELVKFHPRATSPGYSWGYIWTADDDSSQAAQSDGLDWN